MIELETLGYGVAVVAASALARHAKGKGEGWDPLICAAGLTVICAASNIRYYTTAPSDVKSMGFYPLMDAGLAAVVFGLHLKRPATWKVWLFTFLGGSCLTHVWFWALSDRSDQTRWTYIFIINRLFEGALVCAAFPGGRHVGSAIGRWLSDRRWHSRLPDGVTQHREEP